MTESLSDKIASILNTAPTSFDPEDDVHEETTARVDHNLTEEALSDEETLSKIRKDNVELLEDIDTRYKGKKASRKSISKSQEWNLSEAESAELSNDSDGAEDEDLSSTNHDTEDSESNEEGSEIEENEFEANEDNFKHMVDTDTLNELTKGNCVRQQLHIWENLLEMRIQLQKCLITANKLPQASTFAPLKDTHKNEIDATKQSVRNLLDKFLYLQSLLWNRYPETKNLMKDEINNKPQDEDDEEIQSDSEEETPEIPLKKRKYNDLGLEIVKRHTQYKSYRNSVIQKWNDKTRIASNKTTTPVHSVINQIDHILSDKDKLIKKTQLKKTDYEIIGASESNSNSEEYNTEIFDDTDFYHHLLRELIEYKSSDVTDPVQLGRQWIHLQNLRSKMKRKMDTKATKGRKIRYTVHSKLVNFMAPVEDISWQNEAKTELFNSLFGKNQSTNSV